MGSAPSLPRILYQWPTWLKNRKRCLAFYRDFWRKITLWLITVFFCGIFYAKLTCNLMLSENKIKELVEYWVKNSKIKLKSMKKLYESGCYADALYYGHMILEMILKAHVVKNTKKPALKIHNLRRLSEMAEAELELDDVKLLVKVNEFNMDTRYPDEKMKFYKLCTKRYTNEFYEPIITLHKKLCQKVK